MIEFTREELIKIVPVGIATLVALLGWGVTYFHKWHFDRRANRLERINRQLKELYGPLYITLKTAHEAWESFVKKYWPNHGGKFYFSEEHEPTEDEKERWRTWMKNVFEPLHKKVENITMGNCDLFENGEIPESILEALAHVSVYKAVLAQWEDNNYSEHISINSWPTEALMCEIEPKYKNLVKIQQELLG